MLRVEHTDKLAPSDRPWQWNDNCRGKESCPAYVLNNGRLRCNDCTIVVPVEDKRQAALKLD